MVTRYGPQSVASAKWLKFRRSSRTVYLYDSNGNVLRISMDVDRTSFVQVPHFISPNRILIDTRLK